MLSNVLELTDEHDAIHAALRDEPVFEPPVPGEDALAVQAVEAAAATRIAAVARTRGRTSKPSKDLQSTPLDPPSRRALMSAPAKSLPRLEANGAPAEDAVTSARSMGSTRSMGTAKGSVGSTRSMGTAKGSVGSTRSAPSGLDEKRGVSPLLVRPSVDDFRRLEQMAASMTAPQILAEIKRMTAEASPPQQQGQKGQQGQHAQHAQHAQPLDRDGTKGHRGRDGAPAMRNGRGKDEHNGKKRVVAPTLRPSPTHVRGHASPPLLRRSAADEGEVELELADGDAVAAEAAECAVAAAEAHAHAAPALQTVAKPLTPSSAASSAARAAPGGRGVASARMAPAPSHGPPAGRRGASSGGRPSPAGMMRLLPTAPDLRERTPTARHRRQDSIGSGLSSPARKPKSSGQRSSGGSSGGGAAGRRPGSPVSWRAPVADSPTEESPRTAAVKRAKAAAQAQKPSPAAPMRPSEDALDPW